MSKGAFPNSTKKVPKYYHFLPLYNIYKSTLYLCVVCTKTPPPKTFFCAFYTKLKKCKKKCKKVLDNAFTL